MRDGASADREISSNVDGRRFVGGETCLLHERVTIHACWCSRNDDVAGLLGHLFLVQ